MRIRARAATAAANNARMLELRKAGLTYQRIAETVGVSRQAAHKAVTKALRELVELTAKEAAEIRALEMARLDALMVGLWATATRGNLGAVDRVLRIMERRAKLLGLDAATKIAPTKGDELEPGATGLFIVPAEAGSVDEWLAQTRAWQESKGRPVRQRCGPFRAPEPG